METFSRGTDLISLDPWYVTGILEGLASFTFSRSGQQLTLYLALKVPTRDRPLLLSIQHHWGGIGKIYDIQRGRVADLPGSSYYRICRHDELAFVVDHLEAYPLQGRKTASFAIWREMVQLKREFRNAPADKLHSLAAALSDLTKRGGNEPPR